eukprot:gene50496-59400_t
MAVSNRVGFLTALRLSRHSMVSGWVSLEVAHVTRCIREQHGCVGGCAADHVNSSYAA